MLILGLASLLQVIFLPGFIIIWSLGITDGMLKSIILAFTLSMIVNHFIAITLTYAGCFNSTNLYILFLFEIIIVCWQTRYWLKMPFSQISKRLKSSLKPLTTETNLSLINCSVVVALAYFMFQLVANAGSVIDGWDPLFSWNRWAVDWYHGRFPSHIWHYPQLLPSNWSITYLFIGTDKIQFFATAIMPLFPLFSLLALFDLWKRKKEPA